MMKYQKQKGSKDCGVFAIAIATSLSFGLCPTNLLFRQDLMRSHLVNCFNKNNVTISLQVIVAIKQLANL